MLYCVLLCVALRCAVRAIVAILSGLGAVVLVEADEFFLAAALSFNNYNTGFRGTSTKVYGNSKQMALFIQIKEIVIFGVLMDKL